MTADDGVPTARSRRRVLIVTPTVPYPPNWGFGIRVFNIVKELGRTCDVVVACYADQRDHEKVAALRTHCHDVRTVAPPAATVRDKRFLQLRSLLSRRSYQARGASSPAMAALLHELLAEGFDVVQLESSQLTSILEPGPTPMVLDEHNLEYELLQRMYEVERSPLRKLYNWLEYRKFRTEEVDAWHRCDGCVLTSEREHEIVRRQAPQVLSAVVPNGVDIDLFRPENTEIDPDSVVYTGLMSYRPNSDAVTYFVREVLPLILAVRPTTMFTIVGLGAEQAVGFLAGPNVRVLSDVPDVRPHVQRAAVLAVPLRMGSGTRLKILEGLAMGKAIVSTSVGCEGITVEDGEHLLVRDDPRAFADAVVSLLDDPDTRVRLGRKGRGCVEAGYSWVSVVDELSALHDRVLAGRHRRSLDD